MPVFGAFVIRDEFEDGLNLPKGKYEIPLAIYDRSFDREGQLYYPVSPEPELALGAGSVRRRDPGHGKMFPYLEVEPRVPLCILNAANGRFFTMALSNGQDFHQIGTDLGLLPAPVSLKSLLIAPADAPTWS
jgi:spore coat protein A